MRVPKRLRPYLPNYSNKLALVSQSDERPFRAYWRVSLFQIVGGRTWSLTFVRFQTRKPELVSNDARVIYPGGSQKGDIPS